MGYHQSKFRIRNIDRTLDVLEIQAFATWAQLKVEELWDPYIITFMFAPLGQKPAARYAIMRQEVERVYAKTLTRIIRRPLADSQRERLPIWLASPDFPVFKREKQLLREITTNDGMHFHALALLPNKSRMKTSLIWEIKSRPRVYTPVGQDLRRLHVELIELDDVAYVTEYIMKSVRTGRVSSDDILILPKAKSELVQKPTALNPTLGRRLRGIYQPAIYIGQLLPGG